MKKTVSLLIIATFISILFSIGKTKVLGNEIVEKLTYLQQVRNVAKEMDVFPIDYIARYGPLSDFENNSYGVHRIHLFSPIQFCCRVELTKEAFRQFYDFCQLTLDTTPADINACLDYMDEATPREKALLMTVFYIYIYPWEKQEPLPPMFFWGNPTSWFSRQFVGEAFDLTVRKRDRNDCEIHKKIFFAKIIESIDDDRVAFPAIVSDSKVIGKTDHMEDFITSVATTERILVGIDWSDSGISWRHYTYYPNRSIVCRKIRKAFPDNSQKIIADMLYSLYRADMFTLAHGYFLVTGNASTEPKTVGQIAQQLLESWPESDSSTTTP